MAVEFTDEDEQPIANALCGVAKALRDLGNADAATPMGGLEALGAVLKEGLCQVATYQGESLTEIAAAIDRHAEAIFDLAEAVRSLKQRSHDREVE